MKDVANRETFLRSDLRAMNLWSTASELRQMKQEEWSLSRAGVKLDYFRKLEEGLKKTFRFNLFSQEHEQEILKKLDDFMMTMISYDDMYEEIYRYLQDNGEKNKSEEDKKRE